MRPATEPYRSTIGARPAAGPARVLLCSLLLVGGCRRDGGPHATSQPDAKPIERTAERGPVQVTVRVNRDSVTIAEPIELDIEARAEPQVEVRMPRFGEVTAGLSIRDFTDRTPRPDDSPRIWRRTYRLESFVSGEVELPAIRVEFTDHRAQPGAATQTAIESAVDIEPIRVKVESLLEGQFDPQNINDIKDAVTLPRPRSYIIAVVSGIAVAALVAIAAAVWYLRRRRRAARTVRMPPHQWAMLELERLVAEDLIGRGQVVEFYYRLNGLLRRYIELRFGLQAAEQTSEEFLRALQTDDRLPDMFKPLLTEFVAACDPVKYARYQPGRDEIEAVFNAARDFITGTRTPQSEVELVDAAAPQGAAA